MIRILYGNKNKVNKKWLCEVHDSFKNEWAKDEITYYVLGSENEKWLKNLGAKDVRLVNSKDDMRPANKSMSHFYNKSYLLEYSMRDYDEILFIDYDTVAIKRPDERMWSLLREKDGSWHGVFQCPNVSYKNMICLSKDQGGIRDPTIHTMRKCLNTCLLYCRDKTWVDGHLDAFNTCPSLRIGRVSNFGGGEAVLIYYLDREYGIMDIQQMTSNFEPKIILLKRGINGNRWKDLTDFEKKKDEIYFHHF